MTVPLSEPYSQAHDRAGVRIGVHGCQMATTPAVTRNQATNAINWWR